MNHPSPSRRQILRGVAAAALGSAVVSRRSEGDDVIPLDDYRVPIRELRDGVARELTARLAAGKLVRPDGYLYSVDAAQLMICFAQLRDRDRYTVLRDHCRANLVRDDPSDPYTRGFVPWRYKRGEKLDASGTTEALRVAQGLWIGAAAFGFDTDAAAARVVLDGYARHASVDQDIWLIRNYFAFGSRSFANNSFLVDYDPDFVRAMAESLNDAALTDLAARSLTAVGKCVTPCGLFYDLIQPELRTLYPEFALEAFSPNDVVGLFNCCTTALGIARSLPQVAARVLHFALDRRRDLKRYYFGRSGAPVTAEPAAVCEYSSLVRLAVALGDRDAAAQFLADGLPQWQWSAAHPEAADAFLLTEILKTTIALTALRA